MKAKFEDPNKKPEQFQPAKKNPSELKNTGVAWSSRMLNSVNASSVLGSDKLNKKELNSTEESFLAMVQSEKQFDHEINMRNVGTVSRTRTLKECSQEIKSKFEIEFQGLGKAEVQVVQVGEVYQINIEMVNKENIPKNPLLFKQLIEKQLADQFGVNFRIKVT